MGHASCGCGSGESCACGSGRPYESCCGAEMDPVEISMKMWHKAFFEAMHQVHVEKLKKKIESSWGQGIDKAADAALESFGKMWQSMQLTSEGRNEFASKLHKIYSENK